MSRKPENTFRGSVHKHLPLTLHHEKMSNPYRGGGADDWYSGPRADLWVEYKFIAVPARPDTIIDMVYGKKPSISALQQAWLRDRYHEGRNVAVIIGCKAGGIVLRDMAWETPMSTAEYNANIKTRGELAAWILSETGEPNDKVGRRNLRHSGRAAQGSRRHASNLR